MDDDLFEEEYLRCDDCGQYYPKSYLKRCRTCGRIVCGHCRPYHPQTHQRKQNSGPNTTEHIISEISDRVSSIKKRISSTKNKIHLPTISHDKSDVTKILRILVCAIVIISIVSIFGFGYDNEDYDIPAIPTIPGYDYVYSQNPHIVVDESYSGYITDTLYFEYRDAIYSVQASTEESIYMGSKNKDSHIFEGDYEKYYSLKITDPHQDTFYEDVLDDLRNIKYSQNLDSDEYVELITSFVQAIPYDNYAAVSARYPITVFFDGTGDCDEKSMLLCGLLEREGYDVVLFDLVDAEHMSVGIKTDSGTGYVNGYAYIEATGDSLIGEVPELEGGIIPDANPDVFIIGDGVMTYTKYNDIDRIINYRVALDERYEYWKDKELYTQEEVDRYNYYFVELWDELWNANAGDREKLQSLVLNHPLW